MRTIPTSIIMKAPASIALVLITIVYFADGKPYHSGLWQQIRPLMRQAVVILKGGNGVEGTIFFTQDRPYTPVFMNGTITGLTPGRHGFHIHQTGDLRQGCASALGHYNPHMQPHGAPTDWNRHQGDLGNIEAGPNGVANIQIVDPVISLRGVNSIIGRSVVVHEKEDDLGRGGVEDSLTTGNAGGRLACGVIGIA